MVEVKIFEDGELVRQMEGEVIFTMAVSDLPDEDNVRIQSSMRGEANVDVLFDAIALSCAKHFASLSKSEDDGCRLAGEFIDNLVTYSVEYLGKKYREDMKDGSIEN